jgi:iron complex transport system substrate-binding protein
VRICSLLPSATEIVAVLGLADRLVGVSAECDWPLEVRGLPVVTAVRIDASKLGSLEIDRAVREAIADGRSLYAIDEALIDALAPDLILTQDLCEVCAVSAAEVSRLCKVEGEVVSLDPSSIAGIEESVLRLAERLAVPDRGAAVVAEMRAKIDRVRELAGTGYRRWSSSRAASRSWGGPVRRRFRPPGRRCASARRSSSFSLLAASTRRVRRGRPISPRFRAGWVAVDANAYFSRPTPRLADGVFQLAFLLHSEVVPDPGLPWIELVPPTR